MTNNNLKAQSRRTIICVLFASLSSTSFAGSLLDNNNGTVTDLASGLIWQQSTDPTSLTWDNAITYCGNLNLASSNSWRLPMVKELSSIVDVRITNPSIDTNVFPDTISTYYWAANEDSNDNTKAWIVLFDSVFITTSSKTLPRLARCVHD